MPRIARQYSESDVYHIIIRGNDKQDLFYDDDDRYLFKDRLKESKEKFKYQIYSYCLMSNHVHLLIRVNREFLSKVMQNLVMRYSIYFNKKYSRVGHVFQDRYFSKKVEDPKYFLTVCKYIHRNPEKACIEKTDLYYWSSYREYINHERIIDKNAIMHYFNNDLEQFKRYMLNNDDNEQIYNYSEFELITKLTDEEINEIICKKYNLANADDINILSNTKKEKIIKEFSQIQGTSINQIARVTKNTFFYIKKCWN